MIASELTHSEQPKLTKSIISDQLQQPTVSAIYRDSKGVLWVGTQQGLYKYNGASLIEFNTNKVNQRWIPESEIKDIDEDDNGNLLIATSSGSLLIWDDHIQNFNPILASDTSAVSRLIRMLVSKNGKIWLLHKLGLDLYQLGSGNDTEWIEGLKLYEKIGIPQSIAEDNSGNLWIGGSKGITYIDLKSKSFVISNLKTLGLSSNSSITALEVDSDDKLVVGTNSGQLLVWDASRNAVLARTTIGGKGRIYISSLVIHENKIVIGTDNGLYASNERLSSVHEIFGESGRSITTDVYSLHKDGRYIWVGKINGLDILTFAPFELFNFENSGVSNHVMAFAQDHNDQLWVGTYSGLYFYDNERRTHVRLKMKHDTIPSVLDDQRVVTLENQLDHLWIGLFEGGVRKLYISGGVSNTPTMTKLKQMAVTKIMAAENNTDTWVATFDHGLFRIHLGNIYSYFESKRLEEMSITVLFFARSGIFLAVSGNRVYQYNSNTDSFHQLPFHYGLDSKKPIIYSITQTVTEDILFGTKDHGLFVWPRLAQITNQFELKPAHPDPAVTASTIYGIEIDSNGNLWCATQNGIIKLSPEGKLIKRFTTADGLQGNDFTLGASFQSRDGLIYFGGTNGYNRFDPNEIEIDNTPSPMRLTGVSLPELKNRDLGEVADLESLQLTHEDRFVTFQFSVLDFVDAEQNQFRYKLEDFDTEWVENGSGNTATYTNLPPGQYVFRAQGANSSGIWNREGIALKVTVLPAPWFSWWAYTLYCMAFLGFSWGMHRIYRSYAIDRQSALLAEEMFEAENRADDDLQEQLEIHDELVRSAYQHNLTTLELVTDSIRLRTAHQAESGSRDLAETTIERISALFGLECCINYQAGGPVANLYEYTEKILPELVKNAPVSSETLITINEVTTLPIPVELASPISIIIYELLENCIQHAFKPDSPVNYIHVKLIPSLNSGLGKQSYELSVHDSGIGITERIENLARDGRGIAIVQFIANKLGGQLRLSQESGTTIHLTIPNTESL